MPAGSCVLQITQPISHHIEIPGLAVPIVANPSEVPNLGIVRFTCRSKQMRIEKSTVPVGQSACFLLYLWLETVFVGPSLFAAGL